MRAKGILLMLVCLSLATRARGQTKVSGAVHCDKPGDQQSFEVGDRPHHSFMITKGACTWTKPLDLDGVQTKTDAVTQFIEVRGNRGRTPNEEPTIDGAGSEPTPASWIACEGRLQFEFRREQGLSPGLFLDQRRNRKWVLENAHDCDVLNLFCYTGGFSVAAAIGGAAKVVSVDLSKTFMAWFYWTCKSPRPGAT